MKKQLYGTIMIAVSLCFNTKVSADHLDNNMSAPDSIIYQFNDLNKTLKTIYQYNNTGFTATTSEFDDTNLKWAPLKQTLVETSNGIQTYTERTFRNTSESFVNSSKFETSTDPTGNCNLQAAYCWDSLHSVWKGLHTQTKRTYTSSGALKTFTNSVWDTLSGNWLFYAKGFFSYTDAGKPDTITYYEPDANKQPVCSSRIINNYLSDGRIDKETVSSFQAISGFHPAFRNRYEYAGTTPQTTKVLELFNASNNQWYSFEKTTSGYDNNGNLTEYFVADYDTLNQTWTERYRHNLSILSNSNDSVHIKISNAPGGVERSTEEIKSIRTNGLLSVTNSYFEDDVLNSTENSTFNEQNGKVTSFTNKDQESKSRIEWSFDNIYNTLSLNFFKTGLNTTAETLIRSMVFYFRLSTPTDILQNQSESKISFYPNPVKEQFYITNTTGKICTYRILTIDGKPVRSGAANESSNTVTVSGLASGAYLLQFSQEKGCITRVLIKQ